MRITPIIWLLAVTLIFSCKSKDPEQEAVEADTEKTVSEIMDEKIMDIHDEVMPRMGQLYREKKRLSQKLDSVSVEQKEKIRLTIQELDSAMDGMNIWMRQYKPDSADVERAQEYFDNQMKKVSKVKDDILESLEDASNL